MQYNTKKIGCVLLYSILTLAFLLSKNTEATSPFTCQQIKTNYINAVKQFANAVQFLKNNKDFTKHKTIADALDAANTSIMENIYSHNALSSSYKTIEDAFNKQFKSSEVKDYLSGLKSQMNSMSDKVQFWKKPKHSTNRCREKCGCDLGEKGTPCGVKGQLEPGQACADFQPNLN